MTDVFEPPFRWNLTHSATLGTLLDGDPAPVYDGFLDDLLVCCSRVGAFTDNAELVFVGRSPESLFDHLSGLLFDSSWANRCWLLQLSMRWNEYAEARRDQPAAFWALRAYFEYLNLHPLGLIKRRHPICFVDLVSSGGTFGSLIGFLNAWTLETGADWNAVCRQIRLVGITGRTKNSPNTWRWQQHATWLPLLKAGAVKNVSIPWELWLYLGNEQSKVTRSFSIRHWDNPERARPYHGDRELMALRLAVGLFEMGRTIGRRHEFASCLAQENAMRNAWLRDLVGELRLGNRA